jgi:RNA polymerase sigma-70 factor (ECF subfamily)
MKEREFLNQLKLADKDAFALLVYTFQKNVINICYRFLLNKEDAEDVAQEVFIEVFHSIRNFKGESKLSTWIYRIAVSKSLDEIKKRNRKKRISSFGEALRLDQILHWMAGGESPDKKLVEDEQYAALLNSLNRLPENQRIALTLSKLEHTSNSEIAEIMKTSLTAVDSLIYRAKQKLKSTIKK